MQLITPSQAITSLINFCDRVDRINKNNYSDKRFLTGDMNKLKFEVPKIVWLCSIAVHNKNKERAENIVEGAKIRHKRAKEILDQKL